MKKTLVFLMALVLFSFPFSTYAEEIGPNSENISENINENNLSEDGLEEHFEDSSSNIITDDTNLSIEPVDNKQQVKQDLMESNPSLNQTEVSDFEVNNFQSKEFVTSEDKKDTILRTFSKNQVTGTATSKLGRILSKDAKIYKSIGDDSTSFNAGDDYTDKIFYIKRQANFNSQVYFLISTVASDTNGVIGWVNSKDMWAQDHVAIDHKNKTFYLTGTGWAYTDPWGAGKDTIYRDLTPFKNQTFSVNLTEKVGEAIWYRGFLENGQKVWIQAYNVTTPSFSATSKLGRILNQDAKIFKTFGLHSSSISAGSQYTDKIFYIKKQARMNGETYYLISTVASDTTGVIGWVNAKDMWAQDHVAIDHKNKTFYLTGTGWAYTNPWGAGKDAIYKDLSPFQFQTFKVNLTEKVGEAIWYRGYLENGQKVWIQAYNVTTSKPNVLVQSTSKLGRILNSDSVIYKLIGNSSNSFKAGTQYTDKIFYIKRQANYNGQLYYLISTVASDTNGVIGWVKASDMWAQNHVAIDHKEKTFLLKGTGWAYTNPWGAGKDTVYRDLTPFKYQTFKVNLTEKVGEAIWYRGFLENGQKVWIQAYNVIPYGEVKVTTKYNITLQEALNIQMKANPQTDKKYAYVSKDYVKDGVVIVDQGYSLNVRSGPGTNYKEIGKLYRGDKVEIINEINGWYQIKYNHNTWVTASPQDTLFYLDPKNFIDDKVQAFQFLDLSKPSGAPADILNKLLQGKGILNGLGQVFIDAGTANGVNDVYLISHALLETGNGTSDLSNGSIRVGEISKNKWVSFQPNGTYIAEWYQDSKDGLWKWKIERNDNFKESQAKNVKKIYNMFGIGAYDQSPLTLGSIEAYKRQWFTTEKAIIDGAAFIGNDYIKDGQNTLYKMRWNPEAMEKYGIATHQYATDIGWASKQLSRMYDLYQQLDAYLLYLDIPSYK